ncbi:PTS sugar transporter subunit IIA [Sinanaerobacter chloroacetimidivorans]|uniref:PTS sugar transporter subunit IIA n=1 Tax=Sinanaerobacter chloroacetimidivorans TaxID=2818044 RepID=A0A8J7W7K4_9FIRM|nr:PTS sugar transporter subunit IIA [Sinanaerobacter chloroacetimidivorans]MBR0600585.1 PTS sugar transporter subunit IIA [Sinanaerobacter chloroacetimidivorans]
MEGLSSYISEDLVMIHMNAGDEFTCIDQLGNLLYTKGFVKDTYTQAVKDREKIYPTGLSTSGVGVAIPHTDAIHVNKPAVAIGTLEKPVLFHLMGDDEQKVEVQLLFQLAINEPSEQLQMLQSLVGLFANEELLRSLQQAKNPSSLIALIRKELSEE